MSVVGRGYRSGSGLPRSTAPLQLSSRRPRSSPSCSPPSRASRSANPASRSAARSALLRGNAEEARRLVGRVLPTEGNAGTEDDLAVTRREPLGVVAAILPFNFPAELFVEKCAAALVAGNAVVAKPPLEAPLTIGRIHAALVDGGVPADVIGLVQGAADVGAALAGADGVAAVSLTGSTAAGIAVAEAAAPTLRKLHLELGGNNACLVLADADLDLAVAEIVRGRLMMNGQACSATKRVIVAESLHDELASRLAAEAGRQRLGPARSEETTIGPLINEAAAARVAAQVAEAVAAGASLAAGGASADGAYFPPAVLAAVPAESDVARSEEIFGPVFNLIPAAGPEQALEIANASDYGLMGSVFTATSSSPGRSPSGSNAAASSSTAATTTGRR